MSKSTLKSGRTKRKRKSSLTKLERNTKLIKRPKFLSNLRELGLNERARPLVLNSPAKDLKNLIVSLNPSKLAGNTVVLESKENTSTGEELEVLIATSHGVDGKLIWEKSSIVVCSSKEQRRAFDAARKVIAEKMGL